MQSLFRLMEPSAGRLEIDGVDVAGIGLHDLRRSLAIVPQDPFLFSGTVSRRLSCFGVDPRLATTTQATDPFLTPQPRTRQLRQNLDPLGEHDDADLWSALRSVQLEDEVRVLGLSVESTVVVQGGLSLPVVTPPVSELGERVPSADSFGPLAAARLKAASSDSSSQRVRPFSEQEHPLSVLERAGSSSSCVQGAPSSSDLRHDSCHPRGRPKPRALRDVCVIRPYRSTYPTSHPPTPPYILPPQPPTTPARPRAGLRGERERRQLFTGGAAAAVPRARHPAGRAHSRLRRGHGQRGHRDGK